MAPQRSEPEAGAERFLICCLRSRWETEALRAAQAAAPRSDPDWQAVARLAADQAVGPLLYAALRGQAWAPGWLAADLRRAYDLNGLRNALLMRELANALAHLRTEGIPTIVLKGAALAENIYANIALRPMLDLDVLVHREDAPAALAALAALGYAREHAEARPGLALDYECEVMLRKPGRPEIILELHWGILDSPRLQRTLPMAWFWQAAVPARIDGRPAAMFGPEAQMLHLCTHLALHHRGEGLLWQHDIVEILHRYGRDLDWDALLDRAESGGLGLALQRTLPALAAAWQAPLPTPARARLAAYQPPPEEVRTIARLTAGRRPVAARFSADLAGIQGGRARLRYAWGSLFPAPAYMRERYNIPARGLIPLFYPYRWLRGLAGALAAWPASLLERRRG